jgi:hypothetical protein
MSDFTLTTRPNQYPGKCVACAEQVGAGKGVLGKRGAKWIVAHNDNLCRDGKVVPVLAPVHGPPAPLTVAERIERASNNRFVAQYVGIVERAATHADAINAINRSAQGMTMDYMYEFSQESAAVSIARDLAAERFAPVSV